MQFLESILIALNSLKTNKLRSILTLIGVIIGVMTVIAVVSIIAGMNRYVTDKISTMGSTTFIIDRMGIVMSEEEWWDRLKRKRLTLDDVEAIRENCPACEMVGARVYTYRYKVKYKNQYLSDLAIAGATANFPQIMNINVQSGRHISEFEELHRRQVTFIGWEIADKLFPNLDPMGKEIKIGGRRFKVIGIAEKRGSFLGQSQDNFVIIPITTFQKVFGTRRNLDIMVKTKDMESMREAQDQARIILRLRRKVPLDKPDDFAIMTTDTFMELYRNFTSTAYLVMIGVSSIALVVGGIVIMNIMLVSVTQRTREVGIRKALGAKKRDILWQFLVEAVTIAAVGGIMGILIGTVIAKIVSATTPLPSAVELWSVVLGLLISSSVGIFFGIFPAMKAARLNPIEALRYE
jgi:putative ABC transport system permease protein